MASLTDHQTFTNIFSLLEAKFLKNSELLFQKSNTGKVRILSIDGGGSTHGILAAKSLSFLESHLRRKSGNPNTCIADFFDAAAGSGVGGILAALLFTKGEDGRPIFTAEQALEFLLKNQKKLASSNGIFHRILKKSTDKIFRRTFKESTLKDTLKPVLIPCYDLSTGAPFLFSRADALEADGYDFKIRDVCAATSAYPVFKMSSIDKRTNLKAMNGGVAMNNPTAAAITHVLNNKQEFPFCNGVEDLLVMSLGNGVSISGCGELKLSGADLVKIGGEVVSDMVDESVAMAFGEVRKSNYVRIQGNTLKDSTKVEEMLKQRSVESVLFRGKKVVEETNLDKLEWFGGELIKEDERRKLSVLPTVSFKQSSPRTSSATASTVSSY